jgi:hypothetical protein
LIEKTSLLSRKPAFKWLGGVGFQKFMEGFGEEKKEKIFHISRDESIRERLELKLIRKSSSGCRTAPIYVPPKEFKPVVLLHDNVLPVNPFKRPLQISNLDSQFESSTNNTLLRDSTHKAFKLIGEPSQMENLMRKQQYCRENKENINNCVMEPMNISPGKGGVFSRLNMLIDVVNRLGRESDSVITRRNSDPSATLVKLKL